MNRIFLLLFTGITVAACAGTPPTATTAPPLVQKGGVIGGNCEACDGMYFQMPERLSAETTVAPSGEAGEPLEVSGTIFKSDGKTPAEGVVLYVYHTSAKGLYEPRADLTGSARRHGRLRGWMKTDATGKYRFRTIRPGPYPKENIPSHIHPIIKEADKNEYYIDDFLFADDPLLTAAERAKLENRGGSGILTVARGADGVWRGTRDIVLGRNIPNYR
jgi:protocatechuate 3,4-dioxygenase beta subunit